MKDIKIRINESKQPRYVIRFYVKGVGNDMRYSNNWQSDVDKEPISKAEYWEVNDNTKWNFSEPDACIAWHGKDSYWGSIVQNSEDPENAPKWATILKGRDLEKIKQCEK
jgi:hypothetical protein